MITERYFFIIEIFGLKFKMLFDIELKKLRKQIVSELILANSITC